MAKTRPAYRPEFRRQMVELVHAGRSPEELAREWRCCRDRRVGRSIPSPILSSCDADGDRASQLQHAVQGMDADNLRGATPVLAKAQPVADHLLVTPMAVSTRLRVV